MLLTVCVFCSSLSANDLFPCRARGLGERRPEIKKRHHETRSLESCASFICRSVCRSLVLTNLPNDGRVRREKGREEGDDRTALAEMLMILFLWPDGRFNPRTALRATTVCILVIIQSASLVCRRPEMRRALAAYLRTQDAFR